MKCFLKILCFCLVITVVAFAAQMRAGDLYDFTYNDTAGDVANGQLTVVDSGLGDGSVLATGGWIDVTASSGTPSSAVVGTYPLMTSSGTTTAIGPSVTSPDQINFEVDNLLYPNWAAGSGANNGFSGYPLITNPSYLDEFGLVFGGPGSTGQQVAVNIWGNGSQGGSIGGVDNPSGDYAMYTQDSTGNNPVQVGGGGTFTLTAVPEPSSFILLGTAFVGLGAVCLRRRARKQTA